MNVGELVSPRGFLDILQARIADLTDDEMAWEPVEGCLRLGEPAPRVTHFDGEVEPVATIGWRLDHIARALTEPRVPEWLGAPDVVVPTPPVVESADGMRTWVATAASFWLSLVESLSDEHLAEPMGVGPFGHAPRAGFVVHLNNELIHHGAEVGVLRDLWRAGLR